MPGTEAGYSGTPLPRKLGIKDGFRVAVLGAPEGFGPELDPLPHGVRLLRRLPARAAGPGADLRSDVDLAVLFVTRRVDLARRFPLVGA
ncbi:MAG: hypothetical protein QOI99_181, partial [Actinomycetota bacterium]|nr:hypothetical protein [Actinomycetota bacterium]